MNKIYIKNSPQLAMSIAQDIAEVQPLDSYHGSIFKMKKLPPHVCGPACLTEEPHLVHNFIHGWVLTFNCPVMHSEYGYLSVTQEDIKEIRKDWKVTQVVEEACLEST